MTDSSVVHDSFRIERSYPAPPQRVFAAWASQPEKDRWFGGGDEFLAVTNEYTLDFRVGGRERHSGTLTGGKEFSYDAIYQDIVDDRRIVAAYDVCIDGRRVSVSLLTIANGVPNHAKYGYRKDDQTRRLVPDSQEAPWVEPTFERRADGWTWERLADWLNEQGAPTRDGGGWAVSSIRQIISSRVYLGEIRSGEVVNTTAHDPLVSLELLARANSVHKTPLRRVAGQFLLSGLLRCAGCGMRMAGRSDHVTAAGGDQVTYRYYTCRRRFSCGRCPAPARVRADEIEKLVDDAFHDRFLTGWNGRPAQSSE